MGSSEVNHNIGYAQLQLSSTDISYGEGMLALLIPVRNDEREI